MRKGRFSEEQIIAILREQGAGMATVGGIEVSDAKRVKAREDEDRKLKKLMPRQLLDNSTLKISFRPRPLGKSGCLSRSGSCDLPVPR